MNPFELDYKQLDEHIMDMKKMYPKAYDKKKTSPYTKTRIILLNGTEFESCWFMHQFARNCDNDEIKKELAVVRAQEQMQQKRLAGLKPINESILETTIAYEQLAIDLTATLAQREKDKQEFLKTIQELQDKEPIVIDANKEEEEKRRLANITKMNSRLSRIKSSTKKIENKAKEEKAAKANAVEKPVEVVEVVEEPQVQVVQVVEKEEKAEKPRFKKEYYESRLEVLQKELKDVQAEFKANKKDFVPLQKVYKTFEKDEAKLRRQEAIVAKQQINLHGVNKNKISDEKKAKLEENTKKLKELKESVYSCKLVIEQNKDRYPILEKNNQLLQKQITRLTEDIASVNEALKWYEENNN